MLLVIVLVKVVVVTGCPLLTTGLLLPISHWIHHITVEENWKIQNLPLARVKKIMKAEEFVIQELEKDRLRAEEKSEEEASKHKLMIAADAPVLLSRACELLVRELTCRAWRHTERNKRRTLQRQDIHAAVGESEVYDFLIDIVPRVTPASRAQQQQQPPAAPPQEPSPLDHAAFASQAAALGISPTALDPTIQRQPKANAQAMEALQAQLQLFQQQQQQQQPQAQQQLVASLLEVQEGVQAPPPVEEGEWEESLNL